MEVDSATRVVMDGWTLYTSKKNLQTVQPIRGVHI